MTETSTTATNSLPNTKAENSISTDELGEGEQLFYSSIEPELNALTRNPDPKTVSSILAFSKSL